MIQFFELNKLTAAEKAKIMRRSETDISNLLPLAQEVTGRVRDEGDAAVVEYAKKFDAENFTAEMLRATPQDFKVAREMLEDDIIEAIEAAHANIEMFHEEQMPEP
ncbi:MAG: histidinol dehydrogenase, partial [Chloroflexota bacterium]